MKYDTVQMYFSDVKLETGSSYTGQRGARVTKLCADAPESWLRIYDPEMCLWHKLVEETWKTPIVHAADGVKVYTDMGNNPGGLRAVFNPWCCVGLEVCSSSQYSFKLVQYRKMQWHITDVSELLTEAYNILKLLLSTNVP